MQEGFPRFRDDEEIKQENQFLKMKLMLEHGADLGSGNEREIPPEVENQFLKNVMEFEKQFADAKRIKLFDKIGRPTQFRKVDEIPDSQVPEAWAELRSFLNEHSIDLDACSPNISQRELYRFATEELFEHEIDDMNLPGFTVNFIYDEFYPDPVYESSRKVAEDLFPDIFRKEPLFFEYCFVEKDILLNGKVYESVKELKDHIDAFKSVFDEIELKECKVRDTVVAEEKSLVTGEYEAHMVSGKESLICKGSFRVELVLENAEYWMVKEMRIEGI